MLRVTLTGPELAGLEASGPNDHVKVFFPDPTTGELAAPTLTADGLQPPEHGTPYPRDFTVRGARPSGARGFPELDLDLVLHGPALPDGDDVGPAATWAARAVVGDPLVVAGPKSSKLVPEGFDSFLLACDETALPAAARWLELLPAGTPVRVLAEISSGEDKAYLPTLRRGAEVLWLQRHGELGTSPVLEQAVRACGPIGAHTYVWAAGEAGSLVGVRRYLRRELRLAPRQVEVSGYWRRGASDFDHHAPIDPTDPD
ncbi:siderophore-interacting protein [Pengzhenrongella frigida]|uniref:Siderophore-interacting protein n=2 Tax=Pengzhenrongella frigida TaxID=1259133 RepID=A0A4Q5N3L1_9MICO|nr:siderophore-interacting protein [Cellulomonas sp. HLT2-17]